MKYLGIEKGALIVKTAKPDSVTQDFYRVKADSLNIVLAATGSDSPSGALSSLMKGKWANEAELSGWRFSYWMERSLIKHLVAKKKSQPGAKRFRAIDDYFFAVNSGVFFTQDAVTRANNLYSAYQEHPHISAQCGNEELGNNFDDDVSNIDKTLFARTFYNCEYTDIQVSLYVEHRARLTILKCAIDHLLYEKCGMADKAGYSALTIKGVNIKIPNAPKAFAEGLEQLKQHKYFHRYPVFWQWFMWLFGGFILKDYEAEDYAALSTFTGIPVEEIPNAMSSYGILFPQAGGWFRDDPNSNVRVMKLFPVPFMGVGANLRKDLYTADQDYSQLKLTGVHTSDDLTKWNNLAYEVLS